MTPPRATPRRYDTTHRREQAQLTRERIVREARRLFVDRGFAGTTVAAVAEAAGVSRPTVFAGFTSKQNLLKVAIETSVVGDLDEVPLADRPEMRAVHDAPTADEVLRRFTAVVAEIADRTMPLYLVAVSAADADSLIAALIKRLDGERLTTAERVAASAADRARLRDPQQIKALRDTIWTLCSPLQYRLLVLDRGWTVEHYQRWMADLLCRYAAS
jgi:AcrR family transcriptional regulator